MATNPTITSLAILKTNWEKRGYDYIDNFVPFVAESLRRLEAEVASAPEIQTALRDHFGLELPLNPIRQILKRAAKRGFLRRDMGVYHTVREKCESTDFLETHNLVSKLYTGILGRLRDYAAEHDADWSQENTESALLGFLTRGGLDFLYVTSDPMGKSSIEAPQNGDFIVASFINQALESDPQLLQNIEVLARGHILTQALYLPDPGKIQQKFKNTRVYFDTTFLIYAAGYAGQARQAPCVELLDLLRNFRAELFCFQDTLEEIRGILDACAARLRRGQLQDAFGPTIEYFIEARMSSTDVDLLSARLKPNLRNMGVQVDSKPKYKKRYQIDEKGFEEYLQANIGYRNPEALIHDVDCISSIARIRRGRQSYSVESCRSIFLTTNALLARAAREFFQHDAPPGAVPLCMNDFHLGNLLWLKNPTKSPDLPKKRLIADVYAAIRPPDALWKIYLAEIAKLEEASDISSDEYYILRYTLAAKSALMEITRGEISAFSEGTVAEILDIAKENVQADLRDKLDYERERTKRLEVELREATEKEMRANSRISDLSRSFAKWTTRPFLGGLLFLLLIGSIYSFPWTLPSLSSGWGSYLLVTAQAALFVYGLISMIWGSTLPELLARVEKRLARVIESAVLRNLKLGN